MKEQQAASINAAFKCWHVISGDYTPDEGSEHWGAFWEPLRVPCGADARPNCYLGNVVGFYDATGNKKVAEVQHYDFMSNHPQLLRLEGKWREVVSGRVEWRDNGWAMRWTVSTNTGWAKTLNEHADPSGELQLEKQRRVYYQDIVYAVCNAIDEMDAWSGRKTRIACGTSLTPSRQVQDRLAKIVADHRKSWLHLFTVARDALQVAWDYGNTLSSDFRLKYPGIKTHEDYKAIIDAAMKKCDYKKV